MGFACAMDTLADNYSKYGERNQSINDWRNAAGASS
jgi:hypothetical protein